MKEQLIEQFKRLAMGRVDAAEALAELLAPSKPAKAVKAEAPTVEETPAEPAAEAAAEPVAAKTTTKAKKVAAK